MNRTFFTKAATVATLAFATVASSAASAGAQQVLNFNGSANLLNQPGSNGANLLIDFLAGTTEPNLPGTPTGNVFVVPTTNLPGLMTPGASGTNGTIQDLVVSPTSVVGIPVANFLTVGGYTFSLVSTPAGNTFGPITLTDNGAGTSASFGVRGLASGPGLAAGTTYQGVFTAQFAGQSPAAVFDAINRGGTLPVSFSATFAVTAVPEPSTYALLGTGLAGLLGAAARRRRAQA